MKLAENLNRKNKSAYSRSRYFEINEWVEVQTFTSKSKNNDKHNKWKNKLKLSKKLHKWISSDTN